MGCIAGLLFGILQFAALLLTSVGIPFSMFMPKSENPLSVYKGYCISLWGIRDNCLSLEYSASPKDVWSVCPGRVGRFKSAQVFAIAAAAMLGISMLANFLEACCCYFIKYLCILLNLLATAGLAISYGCMLDCFLRSQGSHVLDTVDVCINMGNFTGIENSHPEGMRLGAGFWLLVTASALSFVNTFILCILC